MKETTTVDEETNVARTSKSGMLFKKKAGLKEELLHMKLLDATDGRKGKWD